MDTPKRSYWHTAPQNALRNVSNGQSDSIRASSSFDRHKTPTKMCQGVLSASTKRINLSIRRDLSKSYGDLSNLRPKSPPIRNLPAGLYGLHASPDNDVDTQSVFSPSYTRQSRQALPNDWMTGASNSHPSTTTERSALAGQQMYHSPRHGAHVSCHIEAEPAKIPIQSLTSGYTQPLDFCVPVTRSHPGNEDQRRRALHGDTGRNLAVEHIDISTAWNGLSDVDANELFRVHRAFLSTLEEMLANELWQIYHQVQQQDSAGTISPIHTLFSDGIIRGISFCRDQLVSEMAEALYSSEEDAAKAKLGFLRLYLITTDALIQYLEDGPRDTSITIRMRCDSLSLRPYPVVDAAWVPDFLLFESLDESAHEGHIFSIVPRYCSKSAFRPTRFPKNVKYSIESETRHSPLSWFVWDDEIAGFKGIMPFYSEVNGYDRQVANTNRDFCESISYSLKIIVQAVLVDDNGSSIRYERILRARLTIKVVPWYVNGNSRKTKERVSVPKAYHDTRLASAAQRFALQYPKGSPLYPERSPSGLYQWSKGAPLHTPIDYAPTSQAGLRDNCLATSHSATRVELKEIDLPDLAQTQAQLVAKCAELTKELENVKQKIMVSGPIDEHHQMTLPALDPQESINDAYCVPLNQQGQEGPTSRSSFPYISHYASEYPTTPSSPLLYGKDVTFPLGPLARFSTLPPPAVRLKRHKKSNSQTTDNITSSKQWIGGDLNRVPGTTSQCAAPERLVAPITHSTQESGYLWQSPGKASFSSKDISTAPSSPRNNVQDLSPLLVVKSELATLATSEKLSLKRRDRSSVNKALPFKPSKKTGAQAKQDIGARSTQPSRTLLSLLASEDEASSSPTQWSGGVFYNSFSPLYNLRSSTTIADEDALALPSSEKTASTNSSENTKHCNMDTEAADSDELALQTFPSNSALDDGATTGESVPTNSLPTVWGGHTSKSSSAAYSPRQASTTSTSGSRSTSSDMELIVEQDPHARKVTCREQAKSWKLLSQSENIMGKQPGPEVQEVRLSADEEQAMNEAMQRSLDELAEEFEDIFLDDSSESISGEGDL